ncbi:hypothetical protein DFQ30_000474, partial [Apophysomyces sp. BC1015]
MYFIQYEPTTDNYLMDDSSSDNDDMDVEGVALQYGEIETLVDIDIVTKKQRIEMEDVIEELTIDMNAATVNDGKCQYKKYGPDQIGHFIRIMQEEGLTVPRAAEACGIPRILAYKWLNESSEGDVSTLSGTALRK